MAAKSTVDFREAVSHQPTEWLRLCIADWQRNGAGHIGCPILRCRVMAMVRAELLRRQVRVPYAMAATETAYGLTQRITPVKVF